MRVSRIFLSNYYNNQQSVPKIPSKRVSSCDEVRSNLKLSPFKQMRSSNSSGPISLKNYQLQSSSSKVSCSHKTFFYYIAVVQRNHLAYKAELNF